MCSVFNFVEDEIEEIEYIGIKETMDIEVSGNNLFYANDILTHNSGYNEEMVGMQHVAGGLSKFQTSDIAVFVNNTPQLRERGEIEFQFLKTRNSGGVGSTVTLDFNPDTLVISDRQNSNNNSGTGTGISASGDGNFNTGTGNSRSHAQPPQNTDSVKALLNKIKK